MNWYKFSQNNKTIVYRGENNSQKKFEGLHFSEDPSFAKKFGEIKKYTLDNSNILDMTNFDKLKNIFGEEIYNSYINGDFWKIQPDKDGFNYRPVDKVIKYVKDNGFDGIKYIEHFSGNINPINYLVLNNNIVREIK
jgi:hypothetical protein